MFESKPLSEPAKSFTTGSVGSNAYRDLNVENDPFSSSRLSVFKTSWLDTVRDDCEDTDVQFAELDVPKVQVAWVVCTNREFVGQDLL